MITYKNIGITAELIATDDMDESCIYYLYEIKTFDNHYYLTKTKEQLEEDGNDHYINYSNPYTMYERKDFTDREWEIAKYLFDFLWNSDNGTNTCCEADIYTDDGFSFDEIKQFVDKFKLEEIGVVELYDDNGIEIYWDYFSCFDLNSCNVLED